MKYRTVINQFVFLLAFLVLLAGCSRTYKTVDARLPADRGQTLQSRSEFKETRDPIASHSNAEISFRNAITYDKVGHNTAIRINQSSLNEAALHSNYFINQAEMEFDEWKDHPYLPKMILIAGKSNFYKIKSIPYQHISSFYQDPDAFYKWDEYLGQLGKAKYYFSMLPKYDDTENRTWERTSEERVFVITNGFREIAYLVKYLEAEILRQEVAQKEKDAAFICESMNLLNDLKYESNESWMPMLLNKKINSIQKRLTLLNYQCY